MIAITLLVIHLFNLAGYHLFYGYFIAQSDKHLVQQLDKRQYQDDQLLEVKLPLHLPYLTNWNDYERVDGEMEVNGVFYNYVKRKVHNDTLFLLCVPNQPKTQFHQSRHDYASQVNGMSTTGHTSRSVVKKIALSAEFQEPVLKYTIVGTVETFIAPAGYLSAGPHLAFVQDTYKPPRVLA
ncbi:hypothetical protein [Paraflavitalea sp. CAU 1676]|uniref:hypothetical protein n=1 Tax=Paraflavitalea sp. CAU 1676 TaxID=3032598 RepID=UPI0023DB9B5F|nr:hypothetical protein [Paraflavitalea sp. CAU 1676]MDF2189116.1 hypothetical protein [Paraflavitalea sp. CAU 1676]